MGIYPTPRLHIKSSVQLNAPTGSKVLVGMGLVPARSSGVHEGLPYNKIVSNVFCSCLIATRGCFI